MWYSSQKTVETRKPVKGDVIFVAGVWSGFERQCYKTRTALAFGSVRLYYRQLRVESWGPKQATFTDMVTGEFIRERGYTSADGCGIAWSFTVAGLSHYFAEIETHYRSRLAQHLETKRKWIAEYRGTARPDVHAAASRRLASDEAYELTTEVRDYAEFKNAPR